MSQGDLASVASAAESSGLPFPILDAFLGASSDEFFAAEWQRSVRTFPENAGPHRLAVAGVDFRSIVTEALAEKKLESLGGKDRPGPKAGEAGWPETANAASARVSGAQDYSPLLSALCRQITEEVSHRVSVNLYVSPPQSRGLDRHQDGHDVLVLQIEGRKRWRIWKSDAPPPLDPLPALTFEGPRRYRKDYRGTPFGGHGVSDGEVAGRKEWNFDIKAGDLIYVPRGWAHEVWTEDSHSAHLTFGFHLVSWVDLLMTVVAQASRRHGAVRDSLPIGFARVAPDFREVRKTSLGLLALLSDTDGAEAMEEVIGRWMHRDMEVPSPAPQAGQAEKLDAGARLRRVGPVAFVTRADSVGLFRPSQRSSELWMPKAFATALRYVATVEPPEFAVADLPGVSPSSRIRICEMLIGAGYLEPLAETSIEVSK